VDPTDVAKRLLEAFNDGYLDRNAGADGSGAGAWVTDAAGEAQPLTGADAYLDRVAAMHLPAVSYRVTVGRLHNFAAHVLRVRDGKVAEWRMADAKPDESDRFWA
jgi:hypothetical protein